MTKLQLVFCTAQLIYYCLAQTQFQLRIGGGSEDYAETIIQTSDSGYAIAGRTSSFGAGLYDMYILKLNANGNVLWRKTIGGPGNDYANSIIQTSDGGLAVSGYTNSYGAGGFDLFIIKLSAAGTIMWSKTFGGGGPESSEKQSLVQANDGGYVILGQSSSFGTNYDFYLVKMDSLGTPQWQKTIGGAGVDYLGTIIRTSDQGYAIAGQTYSFGFGHNDIQVIKLDQAGTLQWNKVVGDTGIDFPSCILQTTDGGYTIAGQRTFGGLGDMYIFKLNSSGNLLWTRAVGGPSAEIASSILQTGDGGYAVVGSTASFGSAYEGYIVKLDSAAIIQWSKT